MSQQEDITAGTITDNNNDNDRESRGLCLLSLDGGGVRGLSTLLLLSALMRRLNDERQQLKLDEVKPCEVFDLIGGTSTGGLIAIMLGRLEMDVDECIKAYKALMRSVFEKKKHIVSLSLRGVIKPRFSSEVLEKAIKNVIETCRAPGQEAIPVDEHFYLKSQDEDSRRCKVFVCAQRKATGRIARLRSYRSLGQNPGTATIWQAALATSAATSFFDPVKIDDCTYVDGAMGANNPAKEVEHEADNIWCETTGKLEPLVKCFISLGTGNGGINPINDKAWNFVVQSLKNVATDTKVTAQDVATRWKYLQNTRYFRFNVEQGLQDVGLEEYKEIDLMEAATKDYLDHEDTQPRVRNCVANLRTKKYPPSREFCVEQQKLQIVEDQKKHPVARNMTATEMSELMDRANAHLKKPADKITPEDLLKANALFTSILHAKDIQEFPATPKELAHIYNKLRATCLLLSYPPKFAPLRRMRYVDDALNFAKRAVGHAIASCNDERIAQMHFYLASVQARKIELRDDEVNHFESPTPLEKHRAREAIEVARTTLRSIGSSDVALYDAIAEESIGRLGLDSTLGQF